MIAGLQAGGGLETKRECFCLHSCFVPECLTWRPAPQPRAELVHHFAAEDPGESAEAEVAGRLRLPEGAEGAGDVTLQKQLERALWILCWQREELSPCRSSRRPSCRSQARRNGQTQGRTFCKNDQQYGF